MYYFYKAILIIVLVINVLFNVGTTLLGGVDVLPEERKVFYIITKAVSFAVIAICTGFLMLDAKDSKD